MGSVGAGDRDRDEEEGEGVTLDKLSSDILTSPSVLSFFSFSMYVALRSSGRSSGFFCRRAVKFSREMIGP